MGGQCIDPADVVGDTLVIGFNLTGFRVGQHQSIAQAMRQKEVEKTIKKAVDAETKKLLEKQLKGPVAPDTAKESLKKVGEKVGEAVTEDAKNKLGRWAECTWKHSPLGIWIDENQWVMYIVVPVVIGAGAGATGYMYHARVGDTPANLGTSILKKHLKYKPLGNLELGVEGLKFVPSKRDVELKFFSTVDWKPFKAKFTLGGGTHDGNLSKLNASSELTYRGIGAASNLELSFKTFVDYSDPALSFGGSGQAKYKFNVGNVPVGVGAQGQWKSTIQPGSPLQSQGALLFTLSSDLF